MEAMSRMLTVKNPDVICFQEMIAPVGCYVPPEWKRVGLSISHHIYVRRGQKVKNHKFGIYSESADIDGMRVFCIHGKWTDEVTDKLCRHLNESLPVGRPAVAIGDFNVEAEALRRRGLPETARQKLIMPKEDTFINFTKPDESHGEIDHAVLWGAEPVSFEIIRDGFGTQRISDHYPIMITI